MQRPRQRLDSSLIWMTVALHLSQGAIILIGGDIIRTTSMSALLRVVPSPALVGALLVAVAALAAVACLRWSGSLWLRVSCLLPQQVVLTLIAIGAVQAAWAGQFGDGVARSHLFILSDQLPPIVLALAYVVVLLRQRWV